MVILAYEIRYKERNVRKKGINEIFVYTLRDPNHEIFNTKHK